MARKAAVNATPTVKKAAKANAKPASPAARGKTPAASATPAAGQTPRELPAASAKLATGKPSGKVPVASAKTRKAAPPPPAPETVTLRQLADRLGEEHEMSPRQAREVLVGVVDLLVEHLKAGDKLRLKGLGVLEVKNRPARTARNPATGAPVNVPATKKITFRPAKDLKTAILG